jgi:hypothetical protein
MKCHKCGFVGFDHLSQCKKCGADLTAIREGLGFSALKSEVPFLLGTLLAGGGRNDIPKGKAEQERVDVDFGYDSMDSMESMPSVLEAAGFEQSAGKPAIASDVDMEPQETGRDDLIIELSEDDLEDLPGMDEI